MPPVPLRKNIIIKTLAAGTVPPVVGTVTGCSGVVNTASGDLAHTTVDIAFNAFIRVPGARPGDICEIEQAFVEGEAEEPLGVTAAGTFTQLLEKSVIRLCVAVKRTRAVCVDGEEVDSACPPGETSGVLVTDAVQKVEAGVVRRGAKPGTAVGPTVKFGGPGVLIDP